MGIDGNYWKGGVIVSFIRVTRSARVLLHNIISVKFSLPLTNTAIDQGYSLVNFWGGVMLEDLKEEVYYAYCSAVLYTTGEQRSFYGDDF